MNWPEYRTSVLLTRANLVADRAASMRRGRLATGWVIVAPSYADIFYNNCFKNGILPAILSESNVDELFKRAEADRKYSLAVDLPSQTITDGTGRKFPFEIAPSRKEVLLKGLDDIGTSLQHVDAIEAYEKTHAATATMYVPVDVQNYS
jgi:3-isopropylmalate/(R)-2-methylmalate dehydratase small subunit